MRRQLIFGMVFGLAALSCLLVIGPQRTTLAQQSTGSRDLSSLAEHGHHNLSTFSYSAGQVDFAGLGANEHTEFEIGSVTKMFTAELLRQQVAQGRVSYETTVGELLPVQGTPVAGVRLGELANHTSGLPRLAKTSFFKDIAVTLSHGNPYEGETVSDIIDSARQAELKHRGQEKYSNLGYALLGAALSAAADTSYPDLLEHGILRPAGMGDTYLMSPKTVSPNAPRGLAADGRPTAPWEMEGSAPAGAIRSTSADMVKFTSWMLDKGNFSYGWQKEEDYFWHNGATGGYTSMLIIDPDRQRAVYAAGDTVTGVDKLARGLMKELS